MKNPVTVSLLIYLKSHIENMKCTWNAVGAVISSDTLTTITRMFRDDVTLVCLFSGEFEDYAAGREYILKIIRENPTSCPMIEEISFKSFQNVIGFNI